MKIGFLVPTYLESKNLDTLNDVIFAGHGPGKTAACSAASELIFEHGCDTVIIWGTAGSFNHEQGDVVVAEKAAYFDYDVSAAMGGIPNQIPGIEDSPWMHTDPFLTAALTGILKEIFPDYTILRGNVCTGDVFKEYSGVQDLNPIEAASDAFDMESAAVVHFCRNLKREVRTAVLRVVSNSVFHTAHQDFAAFLQDFSLMNLQLSRLQKELLKTAEPLSAQ